jgi:hypothetical protein
MVAIAGTKIMNFQLELEHDLEVTNFTTEELSKSYEMLPVCNYYFTIPSHIFRKKIGRKSEKTKKA